MQKNAMRYTLLLSLGALATGAAQAQTCANPIPFPFGVPSVAGNTCTSANDISTFCGLFPSPDNDVVTRFTVDATRTATAITISTSTPTWNFRAFLLQGTCSAATVCADSIDSFGDGGAETLLVGSLPVGAYFLVVNTSGDPSTASCGAFTAAANGRLPVQLKSFSID